MSHKDEWLPVCPISIKMESVDAHVHARVFFRYPINGRVSSVCVRLARSIDPGTMVAVAWAPATPYAESVTSLTLSFPVVSAS
jgi:hypothetical protein